MVLCPIAIAVGCKKCPVFGICPVKSVIGDYKPEAEAKPKPAPAKAAPARASSTKTAAAKASAGKSTAGKHRRGRRAK
jgi:hypothetical protein